MLTKIYAGLWFIVAFAAGLLFLIGNFTMFTAVVFGFIVFGLVFAGMMCVLPYEVSHPKSKPSEVLSEGVIRRKSGGFIEHARAFATELTSPEGVEMRKPKYH